MGQVRVVVTRIERDGTVHRRMVDTAQPTNPAIGKTSTPAPWPSTRPTAPLRAPLSTTSVWTATSSRSPAIASSPRNSPHLSATSAECRSGGRSALAQLLRAPRPGPAASSATATTAAAPAAQGRFRQTTLPARVTITRMHLVSIPTNPLCQAWRSSALVGISPQTAASAREASCPDASNARRKARTSSCRLPVSGTSGTARARCCSASPGSSRPFRAEPVAAGAGGNGVPVSSAVTFWSALSAHLTSTGLTRGCLFRQFDGNRDVLDQIPTPPGALPPL